MGELTDQASVVINAPRMILDIAEMAKDEKYHFIIIELAEGFKDRAGTRLAFYHR